MWKEKFIIVGLSNTISRSIVKMEIYPVMHFVLLFITLAHLIEQITDPIYFTFQIFKWFNPINYMNPSTILQIVTIFCVFPTFTILIITLKLWKSTKIETNVFEHYCIKISVNIAYTISYSLCSPIIRSSFAAFSS